MTGIGGGVSIGCDAGRRPPIFDSVDSSPIDDSYATGFIPGSGTFYCVGCGARLSMDETVTLPVCPSCGGSRFRRDSIFESQQDHGATTAELRVPAEKRSPHWLRDARRLLPPGRHLALRDDAGEIQTFTIERGWTRIGRSSTADLRLDAPSVSRRHALIVAEPEKVLRVLDDRSLNGLFVNGKPVEWGTLRDGDELTIGRYSLYVLET